MTDTSKKLWAALKKADLKKVTAAAPNADLVATNKTGLTPLGFAALHGHAAAVRALLDAGADPDGAMEHGVVPLVLAARHPDACAALAERADVSLATEAGTTALHRAAFWNQRASVEALLARGADVTARDRHGRDALSFAAERADVEIVAALLDAGAEIDGLGRAPREALFPFESELHLRPRPEVTPLALTCRPGREEARALLLARGAQVDAIGADRVSPLMVAAAHGLAEMVEALAEAGADVGRVADAHRGGGLTALYGAVDGRHRELAERLLALGAPASASDAMPALHAAVRRGDVAVTRSLLAAGADPDARGVLGLAIERAAELGHASIVAALLEAGADPGEARVFAESKGNEEMLALFAG